MGAFQYVAWPSLIVGRENTAHGVRRPGPCHEPATFIYIPLANYSFSILMCVYCFCCAQEQRILKCTPLIYNAPLSKAELNYWLKKIKGKAF